LEYEASLQIASMGFPSLLIGGVLTASPSFVVTTACVVEAQLQTTFDSNIAVNFEIENFDFTYPSNNPLASGTANTPSALLLATTAPNVDASTIFGFRVIHQLNVLVSAFSQEVQLPSTYNVGFNIEMSATPVTINNAPNVEACTTTISFI